MQLPQTPKEVLEVALSTIQDPDHGPYTKCVVILLNDNDDSYNRGIISNGLPAHEITGLLNQCSFDVMYENALYNRSVDQGNNDEDEPWRRSLRPY